MTLLLILFAPAATGLILFGLPPAWLRPAAITGSLLSLVMSLLAMGQAAAGAPLSLQAAWVPAAGLSFSLAADGVSSSLLALNALVTALALVAADAGRLARPKLFLSMILLAETAVAGVLLARDLVLFFVAWEAVLVPVFVLIAGYGEGRRVRAAMKLLIFTSAGSLAMLLSILALFAIGGARSFAMDQLAQPVGPTLVFFGFALAFGIKAPLFPFHGWLADAYTAAPTPVVMVLAGVVSKLGPYGFYKVLIPMLPSNFQRWSPLLMSLAVAGVIYGALLAVRQDDVKRMVAYISLSHMCFITLGITSLVPAGVNGALLQMLNHGVLIAALFFIAGHIETATGTRLRSRLSGLSRRAPALSAVFLVLSLATLGLPGLNGFVGEYLVMLGTFARSWYLLAGAALGVVLAAWYTLRLYQGLMNGPPRDEVSVEVGRTATLVLVPLASLAVVIGVYPGPLLALLGQGLGALGVGPLGSAG